MLDEEYHTFRYLLLYYCKLVVNWGTTFVLEAALMDKPTLQLNLLSKDMENLVNIQKMYIFVNTY